MKLPSFEEILSTLIDNIWDLITLVVAVVVITDYLTKPLPTELEPIAKLITGLFTILGLMAVSGLWDRWRRMNRIESIVRSIQSQIVALVFRPTTGRFFYNTKHEIENATSEILQPPMNVLWFSGITLRGTVNCPFADILIDIANFHTSTYAGSYKESPIYGSQRFVRIEQFTTKNEFSALSIALEAKMKAKSGFLGNNSRKSF